MQISEQIGSLEEFNTLVNHNSHIPIKITEYRPINKNIYIFLQNKISLINVLGSYVKNLGTDSYSRPVLSDQNLV